ncbi:hypothetical protein ACLOJK_011397 [Asimina triloba]
MAAVAAAASASASSLLLHLSSPSSGLHASPKLHSIAFQVRKAPPSLYKYPISASVSSPNPSSWDREEQRWLREEQRWLREEQRWIREEQRWNSERESLLREIADLKLRIEALQLEKQTPSALLVSDAASNLATILQALKESEANLAAMAGQIAESGSAARPLLLEQGEVKEMVVEEIKVRESVGKLKVEEEEVKKKKKKKPSLRMGSEGEVVREMQEALEKLGFYSGEEDMEYSSFSSGTERAVKTWQASVGIHEDGIMTAELLERLFVEIENKGANGAPVASIMEIAEVQKTIVKESDTKEVEVSQHRVFLLGENRWEEPSRLAGSNKPINGSKSSSGKKCLACRGEGRLLCTECDGSGEPNVEPQFLEWVEEGASCPYCEGLGYTICDLCEGKTVIET